MKRIARYFTIGELLLWLASVLLITVFFCLFDRQSYLTLVASLIGVTSLIFLAKGNPIGQMLMVVFSVLYGVISFNFCYYGEMITYLGMTLPMSVVAFIAWIKNPYKGNRSEVAVNKISVRDHIFMWVLTPVVTVAFYFILKAFGTANLLPSTISVATSFVAVYLSLKRSPYYALAYATNDIILVILWVLAAFYQIRYLSVAVCFVAFLVNDLYGFFSWRRMEWRQMNE